MSDSVFGPFRAIDVAMRSFGQITSNLLVYNLQLPYKYDGHHGRDGHHGQNGHHGQDGHHGQAGHLDQDGHNGLVTVKICI